MNEMKMYLILDVSAQIRGKLGHYRRLRTPMRFFHATPRADILPIVAAVVLGTFARYSYRALKRMDDEWQEYQDSLRDYRIDNGLDVEIENHSHTGESPIPKFKEGAMGIDLGSVNLRVSYFPPDIAKAPSQPTVTINREGSRFTPNKVYYDNDGSFLVGRLAQEKLYAHAQMSNQRLLNPAALLWSDSNGAWRDKAVRQAISSAVKGAFETLPSTEHTSPSTQQLLFSIDPRIQGGRAIRPVFTYPVAQSIMPPSQSENRYESRYKAAVNSLSNPESIALFVPQPIAVVTAAEHFGLLSRFPTEGSIMVIDVGGTETNISLLGQENRKWKVDNASRLEDFGGETLIEALMNYVSQDFYGKHVREVQDGIGLQRLYTASYMAVLELSSNRATAARAEMNIPYLTVDAQFQPRHLEMGISKQVLEAEFAAIVAQRVIANAKENQILSPSLSQPKDSATLVASVILRLLEVTGQNPFALRCILIVGGGTRSPIIQLAIKEGITQLVGEQYIVDKVVVPKDEQVEELAVLGAALLGAL